MQRFFVLATVFCAFFLAGCTKSTSNYCINALDCLDGQECREGVCVEGTGGTNGNNHENEQPDNSNGNNFPDGNEPQDKHENENSDDLNEGDEVSDSDGVDGDETDDGECIPNSCGAFCSKVVTNECDTLSDCRCEPVKYFDDSASPDVFKDSDELYYSTVAGLDADSLVISASFDLVTFDESFTYTPGAVDESFDYCCISEPKIYKNIDGIYNIYFSAKRVEKGGECTCENIASVTMFKAEYNLESQNFQTPALVDFGEENPQSRADEGCSAHGCEKTIRAGASLFNDDGIEWFFWTWYSSERNISSIKIDSPADIMANLQPEPIEGGVNEAAHIFKRDGKYYLFYSSNPPDTNSILRYVVADSMEELTVARVSRVFSTPLKNVSNIVQNHGHPSVVDRYGDFYAFYHQGRFNSSGELVGRDTYKSRLIFRVDGSIETLNTIEIGWSNIGDGYKHRFDVKPKGEEWVAPCMVLNLLPINKKHKYLGFCTESDKAVPKGSIEKIRLYYSKDDSWSETEMVEVDYDGFSSDISIAIEDGSFDHLKVRFAQQNTGDFYSMDIKVKDGGWLAPCIGAATLGTTAKMNGDFAYTFTGTCLTEPNNGTLVPIENIETVRICSDKDESWSSPHCVEKNYDGSTRYIEVW
ncbi:MAG: family 43 glycosylhydrolase [bacterium]